MVVLNEESVNMFKLQSHKRSDHRSPPHHAMDVAEPLKLKKNFSSRSLSNSATTLLC